MQIFQNLPHFFSIFNRNVSTSVDKTLKE
jgi:hypothetical protein